MLSPPFDIDREDGDERASCEIGTKIQQPVINAHGYPPPPSEEAHYRSPATSQTAVTSSYHRPCFLYRRSRSRAPSIDATSLKTPSRRRRGRRRGPGKGGVTVESRPREKGCDTLRYSPLSYCYDERVFHCHASSPSFPFVARWTGIGESLWIGQNCRQFDFYLYRVTTLPTNCTISQYYWTIKVV